MPVRLRLWQPLPEGRGPDSAHAAGNQISLAGRLSRGGLGAREVLRYATDLAADLAERHRAGAAHGAITAEAVVVAGESARLQDPPVPGASAAEDAIQFAALLRAMARAAVAEERLALGAALGAICGQYLTAAGGANGRSFKKLELALKVLRLDYRGRVGAAAALPASMPAAVEVVASAGAATAERPVAVPSAPRHRKIRILIRAVPSAAEAAWDRRPEPRGFFRRILYSPFLG
ncbi:MAG: hypothetical protein ACLQVN_21005 [Bryobacteraceae bacterium]